MVFVEQLNSVNLPASVHRAEKDRPFGERHVEGVEHELRNKGVQSGKLEYDIPDSVSRFLG